MHITLYESGSEVVQSCLTLCDSLPGSSSIRGISQARILVWGASGEPVISSPGDLPDPGIELRSPALQADFFPTELQGKPNSLAYAQDHPKLGHGFPTSHLSLAKGYCIDDGGSRWRTVNPLALLASARGLGRTWAECGYL